MDIIEKLAKSSFQNNIEFGFDTYKEVVYNIQNDANEINAVFDKIKFYNFQLEWVEKKYSKHLQICKNPDTCQDNIEYEPISYFLRQELDNLGIPMNEDTFTIEERNETEIKLDKILNDLEELKAGHQIIYDDLLNEITELREIFFIGKKKWHQLFIGKFIDMTASGIVSETISKSIIDSIKPDFIKFLP